MENSKIEWCDHSVNLWQGCDRVSPGCLNCYAAAMDKRFHGGKNWKGERRDRREAGKKLAMRLDRKAARLGVRYRVFNGSVNDWLDDKVPVEWLADLLELIRVTPNLDWLLLTKRPENWRNRMCAVMARMLRDVAEFGDKYNDESYWFAKNWALGKAPPNVWIGTSVEDQQRADERIPHLLAIPASVRFLSCEPLLGPVNLGDYRHSSLGEWKMEGFHWVIAGGESGPGARPMQTQWAESLRDQCKSAGVAFFMKQMGGTRKPFPEIPEDLLIKEFPTI